MKYAKKALKNIFKENKEYKKYGVVVFDLRQKSLLPSNLFDQRNLERENSIVSVVDRLNERNGMMTISFGDMFLNKEWNPKRCNITSRFTTCWDELVKVK